MGRDVKIFISEEYGYRSWSWDYPGTKEELIADWKAKRRPVDFWGAKETGYLGIVAPAAMLDEHNKPRDATAHVHCQDDTYLEIDGVRILDEV